MTVAEETVLGLYVTLLPPFDGDIVRLRVLEPVSGFYVDSETSRMLPIGHAVEAAIEACRGMLKALQP